MPGTPGVDFFESDSKRRLNQLEHPVENGIEREIRRHFKGIHPVVRLSLQRIEIAPVPHLHLVVVVLLCEQVRHCIQVLFALGIEGRDQIVIEGRDGLGRLGHPLFELIVRPARHSEILGDLVSQFYRLFENWPVVLNSLVC
jgi:hypothetical protein